MKQCPSFQRSPPAEHWEVVVIGAGVAGGMVALRSSRAGLRTLLIEKQRFPRHKVCGCCLNATAIEELRQVGLLELLSQDSGHRVEVARFCFEGRSATVAMPPGLAISRLRLDQLLVQTAQQSGCTFLDQTTATVLPDLLTAASSTSDPSGCDLKPTSGFASTQLNSSRRIQLQSSGGSQGIHSKDQQIIEADVVLVCDGLGHPSLKNCDELTSHVSAQSRVGLGAVIARTDADTDFCSGEIRMAVSRHGYVGTVQIEGNRLNVAAAVDAGLLHSQGNATAALHSIFQEARISPPASLQGAHVRGTLPLSRTCFPVAGRRIFLLGDAAGYVEPFTGEGIAWALVSASSVIPLVLKTVRCGWTSDRIREWQQIYDLKIGRRQRICRLLAAGLRHPWMLRPMLSACRIAPSITATLVNRMNHVSDTQELQ